MQLDESIYAQASRTMAFTLQFYRAILVAYITRFFDTHFIARGMASWVGLSTTRLAQGYYSTAVLVGLESATAESLVQDLTTTPPSHRNEMYWLYFYITL